MQLKSLVKYRVLKPGARLEVLRSTSMLETETTAVTLLPGDEITYVGERRGWGHDTVPEPYFSTADGFTGAFSRHSWGVVLDGWLEEVA